MLSTVATNNRLRLGDLFGPSAGPEVEEREPAIPEAFAAQVRDAVASRWSTRPGIVVLAWPEIGSLVIGPETSFRLVGDGTDGWFPLVVEREGEPASALRLRAGVAVNIPVARRSLKAGTRLTKDDFRHRSVIHWCKPAATPQRVIGAGWRVVALVRRGADLDRSNVVADPVIREGEPVRLRWTKGVVTVSLDGHALHDAAVGDPVCVRLKGRRGEATGIVVKRGLARLGA